MKLLKLVFETKYQTVIELTIDEARELYRDLDELFGDEPEPEPQVEPAPPVDSTPEPIPQDPWRPWNPWNPQVPYENPIRWTCNPPAT